MLLLFNILKKDAIAYRKKALLKVIDYVNKGMKGVHDNIVVIVQIVDSLRYLSTCIYYVLSGK